MVFKYCEDIVCMIYWREQTYYQHFVRTCQNFLIIIHHFIREKICCWEPRGL